MTDSHPVPGDVIIIRIGEIVLTRGIASAATTPGYVELIVDPFDPADDPTDDPDF